LGSYLGGRKEGLKIGKRKKSWSGQQRRRAPTKKKKSPLLFRRKKKGRKRGRNAGSSKTRTSLQASQMEQRMGSLTLYER